MQNQTNGLRIANTGDFLEVYDLIEEESYEVAQQLLDEIIPEHDVFINLKTVLSIYLDSWCNDRFTLTSEEYNTLFEIAGQTPFEAGDAVYTARIMIGFEPDEHEVAYRLANFAAGDDQGTVRIYPNPATNQVTVEFENEGAENLIGVVNVYHLIGNLAFSLEFETRDSFTVISLDDLTNGVYLFSIRLSNGISKSGKLVILN